MEDITQRKIAEVELELANQEISALNALLAQENTPMKNELEVVRKLQQMILPRETELRQIRDLEVAGFMQPADEVGGDYYDVLQQSGRVAM
ncbi:MAG: hypothetical protein ACK4QL_00055 [Pseudanabaenaceae cyanobacterium]